MRSLLPEAHATYCASQERRGLSVRSCGKKTLGFVLKAREDWQQHNRKIRQWNKWSRLNISLWMLFYLMEKRQSPARCSIHHSSWNLSLCKRKSYLHNALQRMLLVIPTECGHAVLFKHKLAFCHGNSVEKTTLHFLQCQLSVSPKYSKK